MRLLLTVISIYFSIKRFIFEKMLQFYFLVLFFDSARVTFFSACYLYIWEKGDLIYPCAMGWNGRYSVTQTITGGGVKKHWLFFTSMACDKGRKTYGKRIFSADPNKVIKTLANLSPSLTTSQLSSRLTSPESPDSPKGEFLNQVDQLKPPLDSSLTEKSLTQTE